MMVIKMQEGVFYVDEGANEGRESGRPDPRMKGAEPQLEVE